MRRVTGMRDRIVPQVQMAPGINHPRRARAARARAAARGLPPAPLGCCGRPDFKHPPCTSRPGQWGERVRGRLGSSAMHRCGGRGRGAKSEAFRFGQGVLIPCACKVNVVRLL